MAHVEVNEVNASRSLDWIGVEIRHAARGLLHRPGFSAAAALTLALGVGACTAIFSVVYGVLLRPLPYPHPDRLVLVQTRDLETGALGTWGFSGPDLEEWQQRTRSFQSLALTWRTPVALDSDTGAETVAAAYVTRQFFDLMGGLLALGSWPRDVNASEIVISERLWRRRFGADPHVVGRVVRLDATPFTIVGVAARDMTFPVESRASLGAPPTPPDLWTWFERAPEARERALRVGQLVGRLADGRTLAHAVAEVEAVGRRFRQDYPEWVEGRRAVVVSLSDELTGAVRPALWLLLGAVGCVLLVACANVANLLLVRQTSRARETALRVSLGAPGHRLVAHVLSEALLLALAGATMAVLIASWFVSVLRWLEPADLPRLDAVRLDLPVLAFAVGTSTLAALLAAAVPCGRLVGAHGDRAIRLEGRGHGPGPHTRRLRSALVVVEIALSLVLLAGSALLSRSFARLVRADIGIAADRLVTLEVNLTMGRTLTRVRQLQLTDQVIAAARALPGVHSVAAANGLPPNRSRMTAIFTMPDYRTGQPVEHRMDLMNPTSAYFTTLGVPLLNGRMFSQADGPDAARVAILSASAAKRLFGSLDVAGQTLRIGRRVGAVTIVGVVGDVRYSGLDQAAGDTIYLPFGQFPFSNMVLTARTLGDPRPVATRLASAVHGVDRDITVGPVRTLDEIVSEAVARPRFRTALFSALAGLALMLAVVGSYGVAAYGVAQRTAEIGVRMALGARRWQVVMMIVREGLALAGAGAVLGLCGAFAFGRLLSGFLYGVTDRDAASYLLAAVTLLLVAAFASFLAARRAVQVDPVVALRAE